MWWLVGCLKARTQFNERKARIIVASSAGTSERRWWCWADHCCQRLSARFHTLSPNSTVVSRHDTTSMTCRTSHDMTWHAVSCVLRCACSNMADDEETVVLLCKTISCFIIIYYFSSQMSLLKRIMAIITLYSLQTNLSCVFRLSHSWWHAVLRLLYSMRDTACTTFSYSRMHGLDSESWRDAASGIQALVCNRCHHADNSVAFVMEEKICLGFASTVHVSQRTLEISAAVCVSVLSCP